MTDFVLLPAIDVAGGKAVRLKQGDGNADTTHGDPLEIASTFIEQGAKWIHLVDLDLAFGRGNNFDVLRNAVQVIEDEVLVQLSGGITNEATLETALSLNPERINLGAAALKNIEWVESAISRFGEKIAVGLDFRESKIYARGFGEVFVDPFAAIERLTAAGANRFVVTDVDRDGMLLGPSLELMQMVAEHTDLPLIASGGIANLGDIAALLEIPQVCGAILGKALYAGAFTLAEAIALVEGQESKP